MTSTQHSLANTQPTRTINAPAQVVLLLQRLLKTNSLLTAVDNKQDVLRFFISSIDSIQLTLDLCSADINKARGAANPIAVKLQLTSQLDGVLLRFTANVIKPRRSPEKNHTRLAFPQEIESTQQRENYRILPRMMNRPAIQLEGPMGSTCGEIINLSMGGALVVLPDNPDSEAATITADGQIVKCAITFDKDSTVITSARVCHHHRHPTTGQIITGLTFLSLDRESRRQLQQQTSRLERENARWR